MGRYSRLGKNTLLVFIGNAGSKLINLLMLPFYTRWLSVEDYGTVDVITVYASLALAVVSCSIFDSLFIFPKDQPSEKQKGYFSSGLVFAVLSTISVALGLLLWEKIGGNLQMGVLSHYHWLIFGILSSSYLQQLVQQFVRSIDKMLVYSLSGVVLTISQVCFSFIWIPLWGVRGFVVATIVSNVVAFVYSLLHSGAYRYLSLRETRLCYLKEMLKYSIPLIPNGIMWFLIGSLNRPVMEAYGGLFIIGLFAVANKFPSLLNMLYLLFQQAWMISALEEAKSTHYAQFYNRLLKLVFMMQVLGALILTLSGKFIVRQFTTTDYFDAWVYIPILLIGVLFSNVATFVGTNFAVTRESKYYFYSTVWAGVASVLFNFLLIPPYSIWGACWAIVLSQMINMLARIKYSWKYVHITDWVFYSLNLAFLLICIIARIWWDDKPVLMWGALAVSGVFFFRINKNIFSGIVEMVRVKRMKNNK